MFNIYNNVNEILAVGLQEQNNLNTRQMESIKYYGHTISVRD